jgi:predicted RNase H-like nuclease
MPESAQVKMMDEGSLLSRNGAAPAQSATTPTPVTAVAAGVGDPGATWPAVVAADVGEAPGDWVPRDWVPRDWAMEDDVTPAGAEDVAAATWEADAARLVATELAPAKAPWAAVHPASPAPSATPMSSLLNSEFMSHKTVPPPDGCDAVRADGAREDGGETVTGVDGCAGGWVAVTLAPAGPGEGEQRAGGQRAGEQGADHRGAADFPAPCFPAVAVAVTVAATLDALPLATVTGIDMPLGLLAAGWRDVDQLARKALGRRWMTVFAIPPRPVLECATYAEANRACRDLTGKGFSVQAWGLRHKIAEADACRRRARAATPPVRLHEVHPELAFAAMAGAPLLNSKHTRPGLARRRELLAAEGIVLPPRIAGAAEDDLLDAAAVAWSARRIATGNAESFINPSQRTDDNSEIAIFY